MLINALKSCQALSNLGPQNLRAAVEFFQRRDWAEGQDACIQGDTNCTELYVVAAGEFDVFQVQNSRSRPVARIKAGSLFGVLSLLHDVPRNATVRCATPGAALWTLDWKVLSFFRNGVKLKRQDLIVQVSKSRVACEPQPIHPMAFMWSM